MKDYHVTFADFHDLGAGFSVLQNELRGMGIDSLNLTKKNKINIGFTDGTIDRERLDSFFAYIAKFNTGREG